MMTSVYNDAGIPEPQFVVSHKTWCSPWSRTQLQQFTAASVGLQDTVLYVIRSGIDYKGITRAVVDGHTFELISVQVEPVPGPNAYDLLTLREVTKRG
jgi:hypothetical protein